MFKSISACNLDSEFKVVGKITVDALCKTGNAGYGFRL